MSVKSAFQKYLVYAWNIPSICMVYAIHIPGLVIFKFCQLSKKQSMLDELEIHVRSMVFQDNYSIALKRHDLLSDMIYNVYSRYLPCIYYAYTMRRSLANPLSCPSALGSLRLGLPSELLSLATEKPPTRGWGRPKFHNQVLIS